MSLPKLMAIVPTVDLEKAILFTTKMLMSSHPIILQLRDKQAEGRLVAETASMLRLLTLQKNILLFINSRADVAIDSKADGIHLPEESPWPKEYRKICPDLPIGMSVHTHDSARLAQDHGADYVIYGPIFSTPSKPGIALGLNNLQELCKHVNIPVFAIGGITPQNTCDCLKAGAYGVAAMSSLFSSSDPANQFQQFLEALG